MKKSVPKRMIIYTKDVQIITGRQYNAARRLLQEIRQQLGKKEDALISISEFCDYTGLAEQQVHDFLLG